ncbi:hypothetical protein JTB14_019220 [Gonioctena quinquepunctata]|nr:hypothetical protein JTB14_019220 [Gonioctena quinquepunctata]
MYSSMDPQPLNILGNEKADIAAQPTTLFPESEGIPIPSLDVRKAIGEVIKKTWPNRWWTQVTQLNNMKPDIEKWTYPRYLSYHLSPVNRTLPSHTCLSPCCTIAKPEFL